MSLLTSALHPSCVLQPDSSAEVEQLQSALGEKDGQVTALEAELNQLKEELEQVKGAKRVRSREEHYIYIL